MVLTGTTRLISLVSTEAPGMPCTQWKNSVKRRGQTSVSTSCLVSVIVTTLSGSCSLRVTESLIVPTHRKACHSAIQALRNSVSQPFIHSTMQSFSHSVTQPCSHTAIHSAMQSHSYSVTHPCSHSASQSLNHSVTQPCSHSAI